MEEKTNALVTYAIEWPYQLLTSEVVTELDLMMFLPLLINHGQFNNGGADLYDTVSQELEDRNEHLISEGMPPLNGVQQDEFLGVMIDAAEFLISWVSQPKHSILAFSSILHVEEFTDSAGRSCLMWAFNKDECQEGYIREFSEDLSHLFYARQQLRSFEHVGYISNDWSCT